MIKQYANAFIVADSEAKEELLKSFEKDFEQEDLQQELATVICTSPERNYELVQFISSLFQNTRLKDALSSFLSKRPTLTFKLLKLFNTEFTISLEEKSLLHLKYDDTDVLYSLWKVALGDECFLFKTLEQQLEKSEQENFFIIKTLAELSVQIFRQALMENDKHGVYVFDIIKERYVPLLDRFFEDESKIFCYQLFLEPIFQQSFLQAKYSLLSLEHYPVISLKSLWRFNAELEKIMSESGFWKSDFELLSFECFISFFELITSHIDEKENSQSNESVSLTEVQYATFSQYNQQEGQKKEVEKSLNLFTHYSLLQFSEKFLDFLSKHYKMPQRAKFLMEHYFALTNIMKALNNILTQFPSFELEGVLHNLSTIHFGLHSEILRLNQVKA